MASKTQDPFTSLLWGIDEVEATINPDTAIRGLLLRADDSASLVPKLIARCLVPDAAACTGKFLSRSLVFTPALFRELQRSLGVVYSMLGIQVWDADPRVLRSPEWSDAWTRFAHDLLLGLSKKELKSYPELVNEYATRLTEADSASASSLSRFLLFLSSHIAVPDTLVLELIQQSPVGTALREQTTILLGAAMDRQVVAQPDKGRERTEAIVQPSAPIGLLPEGLPASVRLAVARFCFDIQHYVTKEAVDPVLLADLQTKFREPESARTEAEQHADGLECQRRGVSERVSRLEHDLSTLREECETAEAHLAERSKELSAAVRESETAQRKLDRLREDYDNLERRSNQDLGQSRQQLLLDLDMQLRDLWEMTARMIELVIQEKRDVEHLATMWNQLDHVLWDMIGRSGRQVKKNNE